MKGTVSISSTVYLAHPDDVTDGTVDDTDDTGTAEDLLVRHIAMIGRYRSQGMGGPRRSFLTRRWLSP
jgi:hypothetical protein